MKLFAKLLAPSVLPWIISAVVGAGGFAWFKINYVPRHEANAAVEAVKTDLKDAELEIDTLNEMVYNAGVRIHELQAASENDRRRLQILNEKWDNVEQLHREIIDAQSIEWRRRSIPEPIAHGLRQADTAPAF